MNHVLGWSHLFARRMRIFVLTLLFFGAFAGSYEYAHAASRTLGVPQIKQEYSMWCWAAVIQAVGRYLTGNTSVTQCNIVSDFYLGCPNWGSPSDNDSIDAGLRARYNVSTSLYDAAISYSWIQSEINASRPVVVYWQWQSDANMGHFVTINGYDTNLSQVMYIDPDPGTGGQSKQAYGWMVSNAQYRWTASNVNIHRN
jgi:hypothetical protein